MYGPERPDGGSFVRQGGSRRAWVAVGVAVVFMSAAIWKPWSAGVPAAPAASAPAAVSGAAASDATHGADTRAGSASPAALPGSAALWVIDGLDWTGRYEDPHRAWGFAVAYLAVDQLHRAPVPRSSAIVPTVRWVAGDPQSGTAAADSPAPRIDVHGAPVVALAITWPASVQPVSEQLDYRGPPGSAAARPMPLDASVPALVDLAAPGPVSGTFMLPPGTRAGQAIDWLAHGWPLGSYDFTVGLGDVHWILRFRLQPSP